jgi:hypothetical protein
VVSGAGEMGRRCRELDEAGRRGRALVLTCDRSRVRAAPLSVYLLRERRENYVVET